jgi:hypothetical protein
MVLQHLKYFWWDSEDRRIFLVGPSGHFIFFVKCRVKEEREVERNVSYNVGTVVETGDTR